MNIKGRYVALHRSLRAFWPGETCGKITGFGPRWITVELSNSGKRVKIEREAAGLLTIIS
jgi:hypothetical protein